MVALASSLIPSGIQLIKFTSASDWQSLECVQARPKTFQQYNRSHKTTRTPTQANPYPPTRVGVSVGGGKGSTGNMAGIRACAGNK